MVRQGIPEPLAGKPAGPVWIGAANGCRRTRIGIETQMYQRGCAPSCPVLQAGSGPPVSAEPGPGEARPGGCIIARTRDNRNRHGSSEASPVFPLVQLGEIVAPHQPDEPVFRIASLQAMKRVHGVAGAQFALYLAGHDGCAPRLHPRRSEPRGKRCHALPGLKRVARRDQPPHRVEAQRLPGKNADPAVPAMGGIEAPAEEPDPGQGRTCPVPRTTHL